VFRLPFLKSPHWFALLVTLLRDSGSCTNRVFTADASVPCSLVIVGRSLVIHDQYGYRWACADIMLTSSQPAELPVTKTEERRAMAIFGGSSSANFQGRIDFHQPSQNSPTSIVIEVDGMPNSLGLTMATYHIHDRAITLTPAASACSAEAVGGHYNPKNVSGRCDPQRQSTCESGDLSGKHGTLNGMSARGRYLDFDLELSGPNRACQLPLAPTRH
jgi:Cu/Zn superoxide dismutase